MATPPPRTTRQTGTKDAVVTQQALAVNPQVQPAQAEAYATPQQLPPALSTMTPPTAADAWHAQLYSQMQQCGCPLCQDTLAQWTARGNRGATLQIARATGPQARRVLVHEQVAAAAALIHEQKLPRKR